MSRKLLTEKHMKEFGKQVLLYSFYLASYQVTPFILTRDKGTIELNGFFHGLFDQFFSFLLVQI